MSRELSFADAIEAALDEAMTEDPRVVVFGEDVRMLRRNLLVRHGADRVRDTPISESAFLGAAVTAAMGGLRPVVEIMFIDFIGVAFDGLLNHAAKFEAFSGGTWKVPLVVRASCGGWYGDGGQHEQVLWGILSGIPGLCVVAPSTPADAAGLMCTAIGTDCPVVFLEHKLMADYWLDYLGGARRPTVDFDSPVAGCRGEVPDPIVPVPLGKAATRRVGSDMVLISVGVGVHRCLEAADVLAVEGVDASVVDLRSVSPIDVEAIVAAATATGRVVVVDEDYIRGGLSGEVAAIIAEHRIEAIFARVAVESTIPYARPLEYAALPNTERILAASRTLLGHPR
jgi:acetoin:2,6-dichlorophenolindophenol oxidoreductase subunit beta